MLNELAHYAKKSKITSMAGYKPKNAKWIIVLNEVGKFIDIEPERNFLCCPSLDQGELIAGNITRSHFLLDTVSVALGMAKNEGKSEKDINKNLEKHEYFKKLLQEASKQEPLLDFCAKALGDQEALDSIRQKLKALKAKPTDNITFRVGKIYPLEQETWHAWWDEFRGSLRTKENVDEMVCLLSGEIVTPVPTHGKISGLTSVGGQSTGTVLVGFDKDSFQSYGLQQSLNAACSEQAVALYRSALDDLITKAPRPLAGAMFLHWYKEPIDKEWDPIELALGLDEEDETVQLDALKQAERLIQSVESGERPDLLSNFYYILELSGAGGRIMVRDWVVGNYAELGSNIHKWFKDALIVTPDGKGLAKSFKLWAGLVRLLSYRKNEKNISERINIELSAIMSRIWRSVIQGSNLPDSVPAKALKHIQSRIHQSEEDNLDRIACALLKIWYNRRNQVNGEAYILQEELLTNHPSSAYHAGRLMAVLAEIQRSALGNVGAGIVQRYYAAASSTPSLVLGRLVRTAQYHLDKLDRGLAIWYERIVSEIMVSIGSNMPTTLNLEQQTLFSLGYYQQKAFMLSGKKNQKQMKKGRIKRW